MLGVGTPAPGDTETRWLLKALKPEGPSPLGCSCPIVVPPGSSDCGPVQRDQTPQVQGVPFLAHCACSLNFETVGLRMLTNSGSMEVPPAPVTQVWGEYSRHPSGLYFHFIFVFIGIHPINNIVLVFGTKQLNSVLHMDASAHFCPLFPDGFFQSVGSSCLCWTGGPCWLPITVPVFIDLSHVLIYPSPASFPLVTLSFWVWVCFCFVNLCISVHLWIPPQCGIICSLSLTCFP